MKAVVAAASALLARRRPAARRARQRRPAPAAVCGVAGGADRGRARHHPRGRVRRRLPRPGPRLVGVRRLPVPRLQLGRLRRLHPRQGRPARRAGRQGRRPRAQHPRPPRRRRHRRARLLVHRPRPRPRLTRMGHHPRPRAPATASPHASTRPSGWPPTSSTSAPHRHRMRPDDAFAPAARRAPEEPSRPIDGDWSLPGPRALIDANPGALDDPHHDYPAWDWLIPDGTPIYAVRGGTVATIRNWPHNWWTAGCGTRGGGDCDTCGVGVTIVDDSGTRWTYCHGSDLTTTLGATVAAGQQILWSGNTGRSGAPHLHLEIRVDGVQTLPATPPRQPLHRTPSASSRRHCHAQDAASESGRQWTVPLVTSPRPRRRMPTRRSGRPAAPRDYARVLPIRAFGVRSRICLGCGQRGARSVVRSCR